MIARANHQDGRPTSISTDFMPAIFVKGFPFSVIDLTSLAGRKSTNMVLLE